MASNSFGNAKRPAGKKFRDGLVGDALDDLYSDIDGGFTALELTLPSLAKPGYFTSETHTAGTAGAHIISAAQLTAGPYIANASGAVAWTTATGPAIADAIIADGGTMAVGLSFDAIVGNSNATNVATFTAGAGITLVGAATIVATTAVFRFRCTDVTDGAETFDAIRVG